MTTVGGHSAKRRVSVTIRLHYKRPQLRRLRPPTWLRAAIARSLNRFPFEAMRNARLRARVLTVALLVIVAEILSILQPYMIQHTYALGAANGLLSPVNQLIAAKLKYDPKQQVFNFNQNYVPTPSGIASATGPQVTAVANQDPAKGIVVTDPVHEVDFSLTPQFGLLSGKQDGNRIIYPLLSGGGWVVYTMHSIGVKEDVVLTRVHSDRLTLGYRMNLGNQLVARVQRDGSLGIFGNTLFSGNVATGTAKDAALLQKARQNAPKNTLLFSIPTPTIKQLDKRNPGVTAAYVVKGDSLEVQVSGLKHARYPITIDPSIYVETAEKFMHGNNETNIDFDVADTLIQKGKTTGARFNAWNSTLNLNSNIWRQGVSVAGGYIYTVGGNFPSGSVTTFSSQGSANYTVPSGVTSVTVKMWGGGGAGGGGAGSTTGGAGGGGGYITGTISGLTGGQTLTVYVGGGGTGGAAGSASVSAGGGGAGGYSSLYNGATPLLVAAGGAGGGGGRTGTDTTQNGGAGGAGGGATGVTGSSGGGTGSATGGGGGTATAGGAGGTVSSSGNNGAAGSSLTGGGGADGLTHSGSTGSGATGGLASGGNGGASSATSRAGGGGGGAGYYGGGGGAGSQGNNTGGGGGGGGSSYAEAGASSVTNTAGSGTTPGNSGDPNRGTAGNGGSGGANNTNGGGGSNGLVIVAAGSTSANAGTVSWAKFDTNSGVIDSADPGNGVCAGWCTTTAYDLPYPRSDLSLVAYNGFLYALGGDDSTCTTANGTGDGGICKTVYIAKLGANGEPRLWHPSDTNQANWVYWYRDTDLSSPRTLAGAVAYNNRLYLLGGETSSSGTPSVVSTVEEADITGTGKLSSWTTTGMVTLRDPSSPSTALARYGFGAQVYNNHIYVIGGASSLTTGSPSSSVQYITLNSDGTMAGNWITTSSMTSGRMTNGGNFSSVWGAYIYVSGGCTAYNSLGYCTSVASDTQLASINADGSLDQWNTNASVSDTRMGHTLVAWRGYLYEVGGCSTQNASSGGCTTGLQSINYGTINQDGDASTVATSVASGTSPCSGTTPTNCNLPGSTYIGNMLDDTAIYNGYLYLVGGVNSCNGGGNACTSTTGNVAYAVISSTGSLTKPATCPGGTYQGGMWCVDTTDTISGGIAASGTTVFGGRMYLVGGINGTNNKGNVYYVSLNSDGSLSGSWTTQSMPGLGLDSVAFDFAYSRANPSSAGTNPGNLYVFGGCTTTSGTDCTAFSQNVFKCNIQTAGSLAGCSTSGQLAIGTVTGATGPGLGGMAGTVYANYIYLIGGLAPGVTDLKTVRYAKFDNNNNVVAVSGSAWIESPVQTAVGRRRGAAFGYNGYIYVVGGYDGTDGTVLSDIEFNKINVSDGSLVNENGNNLFNTSAVVINQRWGLSVPVSNSYAYVIGGCTNGNSPDCNARTDVIQTFQLYNNDSGTPAGYSATAACGVGPCSGAAGGTDLIGGSATIHDGHIFYAGGCTDMACTTVTTNVYTAPVNVNDGSLGSWTATTAGLPGIGRAFGSLVNTGGSLYYVGGQTGAGTPSSSVYYATPTTAGDITAWSTATNGLPGTRTEIGAAVWNNHIYVVGGRATSSTTSQQSQIYYSPALSSGGDITSAWTTINSAFNVARSGETVITYANNIYILGGFDGANYLSDVQYAQLSSNGNVGSFTYTTSLPSPISNADGFAANGYMYLIGGRSASTTCTPSTLVAPISANTTIASGNNPTGIGEWYETNQQYSGNRYGASAAYSNGKAYIIGGGCNGSFVGSTVRTQSTTLLSQPQVAQYSIMFDTDTDVFPEKWLLNGLDNSIGARWQLSYRSMTDPGAPGPSGNGTSCSAAAMTTWGQTTNFGNVTLGTPGVYTPVDGSGTNTNCARYYFLLVTIDSSQAYGYPEDVSRGPTITDLTLEFTADPSKRLMHGRTFTGGLQQPDDTPF